MAVWETDPSFSEGPQHERDYAAIWQAADKIVYSSTLASPSTRKTRIEREFKPDAVRDLKASLDHDLAIGGPALATHAFRAGLVDECRLFVAPIVVGGGKPGLPDDVRLALELVDERRFGNGMVYLSLPSEGVTPGGRRRTSGLQRTPR